MDVYGIEALLGGSCWIPGSWISQCHTIRFLRPASFLNSLFFRDLLNELSVSDAQWRIRPWNPIRAGHHWILPVFPSF